MRGVIPLRSLLSIRKASVTPVRNRKRAGGMPPMNCESVYAPEVFSSGLRNECHTWPWSMTTAPTPRTQSRYCRRYELALTWLIPSLQLSGLYSPRQLQLHRGVREIRDQRHVRVRCQDIIAHDAGPESPGLRGE